MWSASQRFLRPPQSFSNCRRAAVVELTFVFAERLGVDAAQIAHAAVAREHLLAKIARVGAELPFVDAGRAAKSDAGVWGLRRRTSGTASGAADPSAGLGPARAHTRSS